MSTDIKALIVILVLAGIVFRLSKSICLQYMSAEDFVRRCNVWFALTVVAFISPTFWLYAIFAMILLVWAAGRDENPLALYAMVTFTIPNANFYIPPILVNQLFDLTQYRILSFALIIPVILRIWKRPAEWGDRRLKPIDFALAAFLLLQLVLLMPYEAPTNTLRRAFLFMVDSFMVFYAFTRIASKEKLIEVMACFWLSCAVMALIAVFERGRGWLLYTSLVSAWGAPNAFSWIFRDGAVRAQAAAEHSINLGYVSSIALGFFLYLRSDVKSFSLRWAPIGLLLAATVASGSRGAWITAALVIFFFVLLRPNAARLLGRAAAVGAIGVAIMYVTPLKASILDRLPFIGTSDQDTVEYRQQLADVSWSLIKQNPLFGDPFVYLNMESLRQGQGIIDIVNGYIFTALFTGFVGLFLMLLIFALALWAAARAMLHFRKLDGDLGLLGASLVSVFTATLVFIATAGTGPSTYFLTALLVSYAGLTLKRAGRDGRSLPSSSSPIRMQTRGGYSGALLQ